jgi:outer membrane protein assembly factor BamD
MIISCASNKFSGNLTEQCVAEYKVAEEKFKAGKFWKARDELTEILQHCTGTGVMEDSHFLLAESHFRLKDWLEARAEYSSFVNFFPGSPYAETAAYRRAIASYNLSYKDSRDRTNTTYAIRDFNRFEAEFPSSVLMDSAYIYLDSLNNRVAENDFQIARLYSRMGEPGAAAIYLKALLNEYPKSPRGRDAIVLLINSYIKMNEFSAAKFYLERLREIYSADERMLVSARRLEEQIENAEKALERRLERERRQKLQQRDGNT